MTHYSPQLIKTHPAAPGLSSLEREETRHLGPASAAHTSGVERVTADACQRRQLHTARLVRDRADIAAAPTDTARVGKHAPFAEMASSPIGIQWSSHTTTTERATHEIPRFTVFDTKHGRPRLARVMARRDRRRGEWRKCVLHRCNPSAGRSVDRVGSEIRTEAGCGTTATSNPESGLTRPDRPQRKHVIRTKFSDNQEHGTKKTPPQGQTGLGAAGSASAAAGSVVG